MNTPQPESLKLEFKVRQEDVVAFTRHFQRNSQTFLRARNQIRLTLPIVVLVLAGLSLARFDSEWRLAAVYGGVALLWYLFYPLRFDRNAENYIRRMVGEAQWQKYYGHYTLELSETGLHAQGPLGQSDLYWAAVENVRLTDTYLFITISGGVGYAIAIAGVGKETAQAACAYICARAPEAAA